jgi:poly(hydroxyalkanoate) granule-associated protein
MAEVEVVLQEAEEEPQPSSLRGLARMGILAGIGAVTLVRDEAAGLVGRLLERGQVVEKEGRQPVGDALARGREQIRRVVQSPGLAEDELEARMQELLDRLNIPSKSDIEALGAKVEALTQKVDRLKQSMTRQGE